MYPCGTVLRFFPKATSTHTHTRERAGTVKRSEASCSESQLRTSESPWIRFSDAPVLAKSESPSVNERTKRDPRLPSRWPSEARRRGGGNPLAPLLSCSFYLAYVQREMGFFFLFLPLFFEALIVAEQDLRILGLFFVCVSCFFFTIWIGSGLHLDVIFGPSSSVRALRRRVCRHAPQNT